MMEIQLTSEQRRQITEAIRGKYAEAARKIEGLFSYPTGLKGLKILKYDPGFVNALPRDVAASYCGVGNPFTLGPIHQGEAVLDVGCGVGVDTLAAASMVGTTGRAVGIDMTAEMLARAREGLRKMRLNNITFRMASAENLPFQARGFDVVISNGVFNLLIDKKGALAEVFRVLKPGGRFMIADEILTGKLPTDADEVVKSWAR